MSIIVLQTRINHGVIVHRSSLPLLAPRLSLGLSPSWVHCFNDCETPAAVVSGDLATVSVVCARVCGQSVMY